LFHLGAPVEREVSYPPSMVCIRAGGRRSARAICTGAVVLAASPLAGCGSVTRSRPRIESARKKVAGVPRTVRISGYSLTVNCTGPKKATTPTIVLLPGAAQQLTTFTFIQNQLSSLTRVCSYDRPGEDRGSEPPTKQTLADSDALLHQLLAQLDVASHGVILVGHSLGGLIAAKYASQYRRSHQVKALVLLDATPPSLTRTALRLIPPGAGGPAGQFRSWVAGFRSGEDQERLVLTSTPLPPIGNIPLIVVRHGRPIFAGVTGYGRRLEEIWSEGQHAWLRLSPLSRMVIARKSGHPIYLDQPFLTLRLIRQALSEARWNRSPAVRTGREWCRMLRAGLSHLRSLIVQLEPFRWTVNVRVVGGAGGV
jgi:hypothetical protein